MIHLGLPDADCLSYSFSVCLYVRYKHISEGPPPISNSRYRVVVDWSIIVQNAMIE